MSKRKLIPFAATLLFGVFHGVTGYPDIAQTFMAAAYVIIAMPEGGE